MSDLIICEKQDIVNIADEVRQKTGNNEEMTLEGIAAGVRSITSSGSGPQVQANWEQNDPDAPDYIVGRTHYKDSSYIELLPEQDHLDIYGADLFSKLSPNANCVVTINGTPYEVIANHYSYNAYEWYVIGNGEFVGEGDTGVDVPFGIFIDKYDENMAESSISVTSFKIEAITEVIHKIPDIYLPQSIGSTGAGSYSEVFNNLTENEASGDYAQAANAKTTASGYATHAEGIGAIASGYGSHAEGCYTQATGSYSHAEGYYSKATGANSHASGEATIANGKSQFTAGSYNIPDEASLFIIGNGNSDNDRSNACKLDKNGNVVFSGTVKCDYIILKSSTEGSTKTFKLTIDDNGNLSIVGNN